MKLKKPKHNSQLVETMDFLLDEGRFENFSLSNRIINIESKEKLIFDACKLDKIEFANPELEDADFIDIIFLNCDLSVVSFKNCSFVRVEFINCKLLGTKFNSCLLSDVWIKDSNANLVSVSESSFKNVIIENTELVESYFFETNFRKVNIIDSKLDESYFYQTLLKDVDLSSNSIVGIKTDLKCIKGAVIAPWQAEYFCHLIGLEVK